MPGVVLDPLNPYGCPDPTTLLGFDWVRITASDSQVLYRYHQVLQDQGIKTAAVIVKETFSHGSPDPTVIERIARRMKPNLWIIGNEFDAGVLPAHSPSSWVQSPEEYTSLFGLVSRALRRVDPNARTVLGGSVSGQPEEWLKYVWAVERSGYRIDGYDVHPYAKDFREACWLLADYASLRPGYAPYVFEWHQYAPGIEPFQRMLDDDTAASTFFCYSEGMVSGHGLYYHDGSLTPEGYAMQRLLTTPMEVPSVPEFVLGFKAYAEQHPEVGEPVESEWTERPAPAPVRRQDTSTGVLRYYQESNRIVFAPFV